MITERSKEDDRNDDSSERSGSFASTVESMIRIMRGVLSAATDHIVEPIHNVVTTAGRRITDTLITAITLLLSVAFIAVGVSKILDTLMGVDSSGYVIVGLIVLLFGLLARTLRR